MYYFTNKLFWLQECKKDADCKCSKPDAVAYCYRTGSCGNYMELSISDFVNIKNVFIRYISI